MTATPVFDATDPKAGPDLGALPEWRLDDLYPSVDGPEIKVDFERVETLCQSFAADYEGKLGDLDGEGLARAIARYEEISRISGRIGCFAYLRYTLATDDQARGKFLGDAQARLTDAHTAMVFFTLEMNRIEDAALEAKYAGSDALTRYRPWIERVRSFRPHQLSDELEKFLHDQSVVGTAAWNRLFDETMASLSFEVDGDTLNLEQTLTLMQKPDRAKRAAAGKALSTVFADNIGLFARITNTLAKEKEVEDRWRKFDSPQASRHLANHVEPEVVQALRDAVVNNYERLSHRYYRLKAKWLGLEKLEYWDRNAPVPGKEDRVIGWDEARETVMSAYAGFSPEMARIAEPFFEKGWIDAPSKAGKAPGAFAHPTVTDVHPYVMLNYLGETRDVMTLAHELGHGVHQVLAAEQGELLSSTPLTLAETASVFGEMLTFRALLEKETDPARRKALLADKVEDMINTVVRQIAFYDFECRVHAARREGELTTGDLGRIWMEVQHESLGDAFNFDDGYENFWSYIPHFIHSPFYVYAYAFGDGLVNALYGVYEEAKAAGDEGFQEKYFAMLRAGGSQHHSDLLKPFGLDAADPAFWEKGVGVIAAMIDDLEAMEA